MPNNLKHHIISTAFLGVAFSVLVFTAAPKGREWLIPWMLLSVLCILGAGIWLDLKLAQKWKSAAGITTIVVPLVVLSTILFAFLPKGKYDWLVALSPFMVVIVGCVVGAVIWVGGKLAQKRARDRETLTSPTLICSGCGKIYRIGYDAVAVSLEFALNRARSAVIFSEGRAPDREDLVSSLDGPSDNLKNARELARQSWKMIQDDLSRGHSRTWRCDACDRVNSYP